MSLFIVQRQHKSVFFLPFLLAPEGSLGLLRGCCLQRLPFDVEGVAEAVGEEHEGEDDEHDGKAGKEG